MALTTVQNQMTAMGNSGASYEFVNRIINGAMVIDQRNSGNSGTANGYTVDRWQYYGAQASKGTWQQNAGSVTPPSGFKYYWGFTSSSAYSVVSTDSFQVAQYVEGYNMADLGWGAANASSVTLSFWVRSSLTGTFGGSLSNSTNYAYPFTYTISSANTWEYKTITVSGPTAGTWNSTNGTGIQVNFSLGTGTTYSGTAGAWSSSFYSSATGAQSVVGTNGATWYVTGVQLEKGTTASAFDFRDYTRELLLCQRYYQITPSAQGATSAVNEAAFLCAPQLWVQMRTSPSLALNGSPQVHRPGIAFYNILSVESGPSASGSSYTSFTIQSGAGTQSSGQAIAPLKLSAEL